MNIDPQFLLNFLAICIAALIGAYALGRIFGYRDGHAKGRDLGQNEALNDLWSLAEKNPELAYAWNVATWREDPERYAQELTQDNAMRANLDNTIDSIAASKARELNREYERKRFRS